MKTFLTIIVIIGCILGYGYWHSRTHASFYIHLEYKDINQDKLQPLPKAELSFLDEHDKVLANGISDESFNYVHLIHPEVGDCHEVEKSASVSKQGMNAWQECFEHLSTWIPKWANKARRVTITLPDCTIKDLPISISKYNSEWFLWWVPHPHIGGKPYTYYRTNITIKKNDCTK